MADLKQLLESYDDQFTLDGAIKPQPGVTEAKALEAMALMEKARRSRVAEAQLAELLTSTDIGYSIAHVLSVNMIPQLPKELEPVENLAGHRTVKDFRPVVLRGLIASDGVEGAGVDEHGAAAVIPEGTPYPMVTVTNDEESYYSSLRKRGFRADVTFESVINDDLGEIEDLPNQFLKTVGKTHYAEVFAALEQASQGLSGATLIDGSEVIANSPVSALALIAGSVEIENREINGNKIGAISKYIVLVAPGKKRFLEYDIAQIGRVITVQDGALTLAPDAELKALFPNVEIIESPRLSGNQWRMFPAPNTTERPVLERLSLRGYEQPEIRVRNDQGYRPGGGKIGIWEGGFTADTASFRLRLFTGAVLWDDAYVLKVNPA
ncbi:hypothetical protein [Agromyces larvae]|uniref:Phage major capsid protein n=1 Tax=Agromyces larvae TaxID=2929802 RepID=A0ABY4C3D2_9MICO|nr:hypothetical protein [Agromyces larvae]UOE45983.1 hypothetical protein MTO99_09640 [Agromyces larvae]